MQKAKIISDEPVLSNVERVYVQVRDLAIRFELRPGDRINEVELARRLEVSRTPLREALNRLTSDGFLDFKPGRGFFRRDLEVKQIVNLYEMRLKLEVASAELAAERATPEGIAELRAFLEVSRQEDPTRSVEDLVALDERFHDLLARMSGNGELVAMLQGVNARIRFVRWIAMESGRRPYTQAEHVAILDAVAAGEGERARQLMMRHIDTRQEAITHAIRESYAMIYMPRPATAPN